MLVGCGWGSSSYGYSAPRSYGYYGYAPRTYGYAPRRYSYDGYAPRTYGYAPRYLRRSRTTADVWVGAATATGVGAVTATEVCVATDTEGLALAA